jgi:hypothetical protein
MLQYALAVLGLGILCGAWVVVQRWVGKHDPGQPGVEGKCGRCSHHIDTGRSHSDPECG